MCSGVAKADTWLDQAKQIELLQKQGQLAGALAVVTELAAEIKRRDPHNELLPLALDRKASLEQDLGQYREAERDYAEAIRIFRSDERAPSVSLARELNNFASLCSDVGDKRKAEALHRESLALRLKMLGTDDPEVALSYANLAVDLFEEQRYEESASLCLQALSTWAKADDEHNQSDLAWNTLALIELHEGKSTAALGHAQMALAFYGTRPDRNIERLASYRHALALAREGNNDFEGAESEFRSGLALLGGPGQREHALVRIGLLTDYGHLLRQLKREKEAKRLLRQASTEWTSLAGANEWNHTVDVKAFISHKTN